MARDNNTFLHKRTLIGPNSVGLQALDDSAEAALTALDSDKVKTVTEFPGGNLVDNSVTGEKLEDEILAKILSALDSDTTLNLIYPGGELHKTTVFNSSSNNYSPDPATNGAFIYLLGAGGGGGGASPRNFGGAGGGAGGLFFKINGTHLNTYINQIQIGAGGNGGLHGPVWPGTPPDINGQRGNSGGITRVWNGSTSWAYANGGQYGTGGGRNAMGVGGNGGNVALNSNSPDLYRFTGDPGWGRNTEGNYSYDFPGQGGTPSRKPHVVETDVGAACGMFGVKVENDTEAVTVIDTLQAIPEGEGGKSYPVSVAPQGTNTSDAGQSGQVIIFEFR